MKSNYDPTTEEYIEIIYDIQKRNKVARVKDIAKKRGVTRSSVSTALSFLKKKKLINYEIYGLIELTDEGKRLGEDLEERHKIIRDFFEEILRVEPGIAEKNACKLEHHIDPKVLDALINFIAFIKNYPEWIKQFKDYKTNLEDI